MKQQPTNQHKTLESVMAAEVHDSSRASYKVDTDNQDTHQKQKNYINIQELSDI